MSKKRKWSLLGVFHPRGFERGLYVVDFYQKGKKMTDNTTRRIAVKARTDADAVRKARKLIR